MNREKFNCPELYNSISIGNNKKNYKKNRRVIELTVTSGNGAMNHNFLNVSRWLIRPIYALWRWLNAMKIRLKAPLLWFCRPWIVHVQVNNCENCSLDIVAYISSLIDTLQCSCCSFYEELIWENSDQIKGMWSLNHIFSEKATIEGFVCFFFLSLSFSLKLLCVEFKHLLQLKKHNKKFKLLCVCIDRVKCKFLNKSQKLSVATNYIFIEKRK